MVLLGEQVLVWLKYALVFSDCDQDIQAVTRIMQPILQEIKNCLKENCPYIR